MPFRNGRRRAGIRPPIPLPALLWPSSRPREGRARLPFMRRPSITVVPARGNAGNRPQVEWCYGKKVNLSRSRPREYGRSPRCISKTTPLPAGRRHCARTSHDERRRPSLPHRFPVISNARISDAPCGRRNFPFLPQPLFPRGHPVGGRGTLPAHAQGTHPLRIPFWGTDSHPPRFPIPPKHRRRQAPAREPAAVYTNTFAPNGTKTQSARPLLVGRAFAAHPRQHRPPAPPARGSTGRRHRRPAAAPAAGTAELQSFDFTRKCRF